MVTKNSGGVDRHLRKSRIKDPIPHQNSFEFQSEFGKPTKNKSEFERRPLRQLDFLNKTPDARGANSILSTKYLTHVPPTRVSQQNTGRPWRQLDFLKKNTGRWRQLRIPIRIRKTNEKQIRIQRRPWRQLDFLNKISDGNSVFWTKHQTPVTQTSFSIKIYDVKAKA